MTHYHPKDTRILMERKEAPLDHLHYKIHYFQVINHKEENGAERNKSVSSEIGLTKTQEKVMKQGRALREYAFGTLMSNHFVKGFKARINGRMIHGMGEEHVRETSLTIHPVYGIPYIPASSIKGALRNWAIHALFDGVEPKEEEEKGEQCDKKRAFFTIFGSQEQKGQVMFYDAFADEKTKVRPDVLTVHFPKYYGKAESPTDDQNPNPVNFYTVEEAYFEFYISTSANQRMPNSFCREELSELTITWLETMLKEQGIGSKTASGYGRFQDFIRRDMTKLKERLAEINKKKNVGLPSHNVKGLEEDITEMDLTILERINRLSSSNEDREESKKLWNELKETISSERDKEAAKALKKYWIENGQWLDTTDEKKIKKNKKAKRTRELQKMLL
ncbi:type III-B CRISPR module RAMP protein Cmr6 [Tindallia californiensis]|uniref:CRISPR-associated protein Cmr6 n=1 Tax=Tindallia californiensis TaxID=159292 RepID=A0A1H3PPZ2_9FIRM|nr:type III-B CRISPR module RAMP protein Cmr6 [Tindallia californiensis]SDZ03030.1 CRISPR-associated protein Cmr6 [Tindallia californiensis]